MPSFTRSASRALVAFLLAVLGGGGVCLATPAAATDADEAAVAALVDEARDDAGLPALARNGALDAVAAAWAVHLGDEGALSHNPDLASDVPSGWTALGENVAEGYRDAQAVHDGWMASDGHRANILREEYTDIGIAFLAAGGTTWAVEVFAAYPDGSVAATVRAAVTATAPAASAEPTATPSPAPSTAAVTATPSPAVSAPAASAPAVSRTPDTLERQQPRASRDADRATATATPDDGAPGERRVEGSTSSTPAGGSSSSSSSSPRPTTSSPSASAPLTGVTLGRLLEATEPVDEPDSTAIPTALAVGVPATAVGGAALCAIVAARRTRPDADDDAR